MIGRFLTAIEGALRKQEEGAALPADFFEKAREFLSTFVDRIHQGKEDGILVIGLEEKGLSRGRQPVSDILEEHQKVRDILSALSEAVEKLKGGDDTARSSITENLKALVEFYRSHMKTEESQVYAFADESYSDLEHEDTYQSFIEHNNQIGEGLYPAYRQRLEEMEQLLKG